MAECSERDRRYAERHVTKPENRSPDFRLSEKPVAAVGTDGDSYWIGLANLASPFYCWRFIWC